MVKRQPFTVPVDRTRCILSLVIVLPLGAGHVWLLVELWLRVEAGQTAVWLALPIGAVLLALLLLAYVPFALLSFIMLRLPGPVIEIGPEGLRDRRLSSEIIPWDRIRWSRIGFRGFNQVTRTRVSMGELVFDVDGPFRARALFWPVAAVYRLIAPHPWPLLTFGTRLRPEKLATELTRYRSPETMRAPAR